MDLIRKGLSSLLGEQLTDRGRKEVDRRRRLKEASLTIAFHSGDS